MDLADTKVSRLLASAALLAAACGAAEDAGDAPPADRPYVRSVVAFAPGEGAGYGADRMPGVVVGPPAGHGLNAGGTDVVSLGVHGEIVLAFGDRDIVDGPGADLIVFENAFYPAAQAEHVFAELGEVAVSIDGETWHTWPCVPDDGPPWPNCAGWRPTLEYDPDIAVPLDPEMTGGDPFDLEVLGLDRARFVRIRDLSDDGDAPSAGFDLDAVGLVHTDDRP